MSTHNVMMTSKSPKYWIGIAKNVGDALTYQVLTPKFQVIARSILCPAYHPKHQNLCQAGGEIAEISPAAGTQDTHEYVYLPDLLTTDPLKQAHHPVIIDSKDIVC